MKNIIVKVAVALLRFINLIFKCFPRKDKIVIISRQSDIPTLDINLITEILDLRGIKYVVLAKTMKKSLSGMIKYGIHTFEQMYQLATAKVVLLDGYCMLVSILPHDSKKVVQMWHALGAVKKFGWQNTDNPDGHDKRFAQIMNMHGNYDFVLAPSKVTGKLFAEAFSIEEEKLVYCGLPRIDYLKRQDELKKEEILSTYPSISSKENVLYAPTFRKSGELDVDDLVKNFNFERFNLIIKKHFLDKGDYSSAKASGVIVDEMYSTMDWLKLCTKVITDYSAVSFEAAILDRQLYIYQPDGIRYMENVGINIDMRTEAIKDYVFNSSQRLLLSLEKDYNIDCIKSFKDKYFEISLDHCTDDLVDFLVSLLSK